MDLYWNPKEDSRKEEQNGNQQQQNKSRKGQDTG